MSETYILKIIDGRLVLEPILQNLKFDPKKLDKPLDLRNKKSFSKNKK